MTDTPVSRDSRRWLIIAIVLGLVLRLGYALYAGLATLPDPGSDQVEYALIAKNLLLGKGFVGVSWGNPQEHFTAYRAPVMPVMWAGLFAVFGENYGVLRLLNLLLGVLTIPVSYFLVRRLFTERAAILAALGMAGYPSAVFLSAELLTETPYVLAQALAVLCLLIASKKPTAGWQILAGVVWGIATLTRPNLLLALPALPVWAAIVWWGNWKGIARGMLAPLAAILMLTPWTVRNYSRFHRFVPVVTQSGSNLYMGNNDIVVSDPRFYGREYLEDQIPGFNEAVAGLGEADRDTKAGELAKTWLKNHRDKWVFLVTHKAMRFASPFLSQDNKIAKIAMLVGWGPTFVLGLLMIFRTIPGWLKQRHPGLILHAIIASSVAGMLLIYVIPRYRFPTEILFLFFAAAMIDRLLPKREVLTSPS